MTVHLPTLPAYEKLRAAIGRFAANCPDAVPGVRDVDAPCEHFDGLDPDGSGDCMSDGHHLCRECSRLSAKSHLLEGDP